MPTEQGHAAASALARIHRQRCSQDSLCARALLAMARPLFALGELDEKMEYVREQLERLRARRPQNISGRHALCKGLLNLAEEKRRAGVYACPDVGKRVMQGHGPRWEAMDPERQRQYEDAARLLREEKAALVHKKRDEAWQRLEELRIKRIHEERDPPFRMRNCKLSIPDINAFSMRWSSNACAGL